MWYLVLSRWSVPPSEGLAYLNEHLAYQFKNHQAGNILFSGPSSDLSVGIFVIRAASHDEAVAIADADPLHVHGVRSYEMLDWEVHQIMGAGPFSGDAFGALMKDNPASFQSMSGISGH